MDYYIKYKTNNIQTDGKYVYLAEFFIYISLLEISNAEVERNYSYVENIATSKRNRISPALLSDVLEVKTFYDKDFEPDE